MEPNARDAVAIRTAVVAGGSDVYDARPVRDNLRVGRDVESNFVVGRQIHDSVLDRLRELDGIGRGYKVRRSIDDTCSV